MKGFIFLGLLTSSFYSAQTTMQDSLKTHDIESINFLKRLPVTKEIINVEKADRTGTIPPRDGTGISGTAYAYP